MKLGKVLLYIIIVTLILCSIAPGTCAECTTNSAMIAVSAVSLLLNITLATVILIQCLLMLRRKKPKDMLHSTNDETYAEPIKQVDIIEIRGPQRVDLRRRNNGSASGIYHCSIATTDFFHNDDDTLQDHVYVGLYDSGGQYIILNRL